MSAAEGPTSGGVRIPRNVAFSKPAEEVAIGGDGDTGSLVANNVAASPRRVCPPRFRTFKDSAALLRSALVVMFPPGRRRKLIAQKAILQPAVYSRLVR